MKALDPMSVLTAALVGIMHRFGLKEFVMTEAEHRGYCESGQNIAAAMVDTDMNTRVVLLGAEGAVSQASYLPVVIVALMRRLDITQIEITDAQYQELRNWIGHDADITVVTDPRTQTLRCEIGETKNQNTTH